MKSLREKKNFPRGRGPLIHTLLGVGIEEGWGTQVLLIYPSPKKITSHLSQRLRKLNHQLFLLRTLAAKHQIKKTEKKEEDLFLPKNHGSNKLRPKCRKERRHVGEQQLPPASTSTPLPP